MIWKTARLFDDNAGQQERICQKQIPAGCCKSYFRCSSFNSCCNGCNLLKGDTLDINGLMLIVCLLWLVMIVLMSVLIPVQLKFGSINGKAVLMCIIIGSMLVLAAMILVLRNYSEETLNFFVNEIMKNMVLMTAAGILGLLLYLQYPI